MKNIRALLVLVLLAAMSVDAIASALPHDFSSHDPAEEETGQAFVLQDHHGVASHIHGDENTLHEDEDGQIHNHGHCHSLHHAFFVTSAQSLKLTFSTAAWLPVAGDILRNQSYSPPVPPPLS